jgi:peptidoglycan hydrolase-like protein with peptidoglycan-binding domain
MLRFGKPLYATDGYRDLSTQWTLYRKYLNGTGAPAAYPGTSNHGKGEALDLGSNVNVFSSEEHKWMKANAGKFGWKHPYWARQGGGRDEAWHWEFVGGGTKTSRIERPRSGEIGLGSSGTAARAVQKLLNEALQPQNHITVDGDFGLMSAIAVVKFQSSRGMGVNGRVGPKTLARLKGQTDEAQETQGVVYLKEGTSNREGTIKLQRFLKEKFRPYLKIDGQYGPATTEGVKHWQKKAGFAPVGYIGPVSRRRLVQLGVFEPLTN